MFETRHHQQWCFFIFHELEQGRIVPAPKTIFIRSFAEPLCIPFQPQLETPSWTPPARIKHVDLSFGGDDEDSDDDVEHVEVGLGAIAGVWGKVALRVSHWLFSYPPLVIAREIVLSAPHRLSRLFQDQQAWRSRTRRSSTGKQCWAGESDPWQNHHGMAGAKGIPLEEGI